MNIFQMKICWYINIRFYLQNAGFVLMVVYCWRESEGIILVLKFLQWQNSIKSSRADSGIRLSKYTNVSNTDFISILRVVWLWPGTQSAVLLLVRVFLSISYASNPVSVSIKQNLMHMPCSFIRNSQVTPNMQNNKHTLIAKCTGL